MPTEEPVAERQAHRLAELDRAMAALTGPTTVAGLSTLIAQHGRVIHQGCYGQLDLADGRPVQPDSLFRLASITKPITAAAVLALHDDGALDLYAPVSRWLPALANLKVMSPDDPGRLMPLARPITVHHLLTHTAGFGYGFEPDDPLAELYQGAGFFSPIFALQVPLPELVERLISFPLARQPGERYQYSLSFDLLGRLIELVSGQPLGDYLRDRIFQPLGMTDTGLWVPPDKLDRFGPLYGPPNEAGLAVLDAPSTGHFAHSHQPPSGGGGLVSTMSDLQRFFTMLVRGGELDGVRLLRTETVHGMLTKQATSYVPRRQSIGYGVGVDLEDQRLLGVFGLGGVYGTQAFGSPMAGVVAILLAQSFTNFVPTQRFAELTFQVLAD